jgi:hypothetical protein
MPKPEADFRPETEQKQTGDTRSCPAQLGEGSREKVVANYPDSFPRLENNSVHFEFYLLRPDNCPARLDTSDVDRARAPDPEVEGTVHRDREALKT